MGSFSAGVGVASKVEGVNRVQSGNSQSACGPFGPWGFGRSSGERVEPGARPVALKRWDATTAEKTMSIVRRFRAERSARDRGGRWNLVWVARCQVHGSRASHSRGVTLIELLVVIAVITVMLGVLLPSFSKAREQARRTICVANMKQIGAGIYAYALENRDHGPAVMDPMGTTAPRSLLSRAGKYVNLGLLRKANILPDAAPFYCPSQSEFSFASNPSLIPAGTVAGSYAYGIHVPSRKSPVMGAIRHLALASDDFTARLGALAGIGRSTHRTGYNVLYTDGSASWYVDADESVWRRAVHWDDETDDIVYTTLYQPNVPVSDGDYGSEMDIFRVWRAFCYSQADQF